MGIKLIRFRSGFGVPCPSPFCMKSEVMLKMAGLDYEVEILDDPRKAPKGKLPYIVDGDAKIADSAMIATHIATKYDIDLDTGLGPEERAVSHAMARMVEERLYWVTLYSRWIDEHNWPIIANFWFGNMPPIVRKLVPWMANRQVVAALHGHGLGRHTSAEIYAFGAADLAALSVQLGDKDFLFGDQPTSLDATVYPALANSLIEELPGPLLDAAKSHDNFAPYVARCHARWFPEFAS